MSTFSPTTARNPISPVSLNQPKEPPMNTVQSVSELTGRSFLSVLFLLSGLGKIGAYAATAAYMSSLGVPGALLPVVIGGEVFGALAIILGWQTRIIAFLLAGYSPLTALIFHTNFADQIIPLEAPRGVNHEQPRPICLPT